MENVVGQRIKSLREEANMLQQELADKMRKLYGTNTNRVTISKWEHGKQIPETYSVKVLSQIFNVSMDYILGLVDGKNEKVKRKSGLIATDDPSYNPFFDETNEYYGDDVAWRKLHGMVDARPKLEAVVRACMELTDEQLDKILQMIGLMI